MMKNMSNIIAKTKMTSMIPKSTSMSITQNITPTSITFIRSLKELVSTVENTLSNTLTMMKAAMMMKFIVSIMRQLNQKTSKDKSRRKLKT